MFPASKVAEIAACFAYAISQKEEIDRWDTLIRDLHDNDVVAWRQCTLELVEHGSEQSPTLSAYWERKATRLS